MPTTFSHISGLILFPLVLLSGGSASAASDAPVDEFGAYFRLLWGLLAVLGIMLILYAVLKKRFSVLNPRGNHIIKVLEIRPIMPKKSLCLVEVRGKEYLLGLGTEQITLVADISEKKNDSFAEIFDQSQARNKS